MQITCADCGTEAKNYSHGICRSCYSREWRLAHRPQHADYERNRRKANPESSRASDARRSETERRKAWRAEYYQRPEVKVRMAAHQRAYRAAHPDIAEKRWEDWYAANPEKMTEKRRRSDNARRSRKASVPNTLTREQWEAIKQAYGGRCAYCGERRERLTQDHVIPISKQGGTVAENIVPACRRCNSIKGNRAPSVIPPIRLLL